MLINALRAAFHAGFMFRHYAYYTPLRRLIRRHADVAAFRRLILLLRSLRL